MTRLMTACVMSGLAVLVWTVVPAAEGQAGSQLPSATDRVTITGWGLNMSNIATGANQTIQIDIDGWSNTSQRDHLIQTFMEKKQDGLLRELEKQPEVGRFRFPGYMGPDPSNIMRLGTEIRYAMNHPGEDGGRRIVIITPRRALMLLLFMLRHVIRLSSSSCAPPPWGERYNPQYLM